MKKLTSVQRESIVNHAAKFGVKKTARVFGMNMGQVYYLVKKANKAKPVEFEAPSTQESLPTALGQGQTVVVIVTDPSRVKEVVGQWITG